MRKLSFNIPISVSPFFWILALVIAFLNSPTIPGMLLWILVIFVSVIFHELGHAVTAKLFNLNPRINLVGTGGITTYENKKLSFGKQFLITLNGPLFGIALFLIASFILYSQVFTNIYILTFFKITQLVNLFWSILNLVPILPLDGGQLLRIALEGFFGIKGFKVSLFVGMVVALLFSIFFFVRSNFLIGAIFFLFGFQNFDSWRKSRFVTEDDRNPERENLLKDGLVFMEQGNIEKAKEIFLKIREDHKKGMIYDMATQYLALLFFGSGEKEKSYKLLLEVEKQIMPKAKCILHTLSYENQNYKLVCKYSAICYQVDPKFEVAYMNGVAFANLNKAKQAGGWLKSALKHKEIDLEKAFFGDFKNVSHKKDFLKFFKK